MCPQATLLRLDELFPPQSISIRKDFIFGPINIYCNVHIR